jgi:hypothetical protein
MEAPPVIAPVISPARRWPISWLLIALGAVAAIAMAVVLFCFNPSQYGFYPRCQLYVTTGLYCPGCGSLRAMHALTHGQVLAALRCNALLTLSFPVLAILGLRRLAGKPPFILRPRLLVLLLVVGILFTILRNIHTAPFIYLAPP